MSKLLCNLCKNRASDKKNSHIIPKFLCKGLFENTKPNHSLKISKDGKGHKIQDTPKEDHILCKICEKRIEIVETHFARVIRDIHNYFNLPDKFEMHKIGTQEYIYCKSTHPTLYKLFIYSIIWRASISNLLEYEKFKINKIAEEDLRVFLNNNLTEKHETLFDSINDISQIPLYHNVLIKPKVKSINSRGILTSYNVSENSHLLLIVDFVLFFYTDEKTIGDILKHFSNKQNNNIIISLGEQEPWLDLNREVLSGMLN